VFVVFKDSLQDSGYAAMRRKGSSPLGKENVPSKRVRKSLAPSWSTPGIISVPGMSDPSYVVETPVSWNHGCVDGLIRDSRMKDET